MRIAEWLHGPLWEMLQSTLLGGIAVSLMGAVLSVLVVLKRLAFIGQGVSHSAFGGIGVAALIAALSAAVLSDSASFLIILAFCLLAAFGMALTSDREALESDTAIGVFLVASMALGAALVAIAGKMSGGTVGAAGAWERALFGTVLGTTREYAWLAAAISAGVLLALAWFRRGIAFWCFDEASAAAFGVPTVRMKFLLIIVLAVATVTAMRLAGVVYATALLVLPGAAALRLSARMAPVIAISCVVALLGMVLGILASIEADLPTGASIVLALTLLFAIACAVGAARRRLGRAPRATAADAQA
jgi:zinc transport system permease protein